jgi:hypothetical protein
MSHKKASLAILVVLMMLVGPISQGCANSNSAGSGAGIDSSYYGDDSSTDTDLGPSQDELEQAFEDGWNNKVSEIFDSTPDGYLYYGDTSYSDGDFWDGGALAYSEYDSYETTDEAYAAGQDAAKEEIFNTSPNGSFYNDSQEYSEGDF